LRIVFAIAEALPFAKVGGLADVGSGLTKALARSGHEVTLVLPGYRGTGDGIALCRTEVPLGDRTEIVTFCSHGRHAGVHVITACNEAYFGRNPAYGYEDDAPRFILFSKALVAFLSGPSFRPDVIHLNDWHTAFVAEYARTGPFRGSLESATIVLTIHNLAYQGELHAGMESLIGEREQDVSNVLARGIAFADEINTVSCRYLEEILTPGQGMGLDSLLHSRRDQLRGILNGVDYDEFDPSTDPYLTARYDTSSAGWKRVNKESLQRKSGLRVDPSCPLLGMVARLVDQKGLDLLCSSIDEIVGLGAQILVMGTGDDRYRLALRSAARRNREAVAYIDEGADELARLVYAGSDFVLAPSSFEPCGLGPLIGLRYGAIPIVRRTGGLAETISDYARDPETGLGFTFVAKYPEHLIRTVRTALAVYHRRERWEALRHRAMTADFSWDSSTRLYEQMYAHAVRRRLRAAAPHRVQAGRSRSTAGALPLALVHHANQYLIADAYDNRQGLSEIADGYAAVLRLHQKYSVPAALQLSGTLVEALAWSRPDLLDLVGRLAAEGLVTLVGGTYSENVMTLFSPDFNRRQLVELLTLYERHLGCSPREVKACWVPERVWATAQLAPVLADEHLPNGGYRIVLLDDRLLFSGAGGASSPRSAFDRAGPYGELIPQAGSQKAPEQARKLLRRACRSYRIAGGRGLVVAPISANLRYWVPPHSDRDLELTARMTEDLRLEGHPDALLVYADDLEKTAGVGGWEPALERFEVFLRWLVERRDELRPVLLDEWLDEHPPGDMVALEAGTFFELARGWGAGEDYRGWAASPSWSPCRNHFRRAESAVRQAERDGADEHLLRLAWKHLLASSHETGWHDPDPSGEGRSPAPWAKALASHARSCLPIAAAASWFARAERPPLAESLDIDADGEEEVVLANSDLFAVFAPRQGGRLVSLFQQTAAGGALVIGNPTDHWSFQEELNRYMDVPPNHPGALADSGFEHDRHHVVSVGATETEAWLDLEDVQEGSELLGARKTVRVNARGQVLCVCYRLPADAGSIVSTASLSPDYYRLLREGRLGLRPYDGEIRRGFKNGCAVVWLALSPDEASWIDPQSAEAGHSVSVSLRARSPHFHLLIGCGATTDERCRGLLAAARESELARLEAVRS
jgi:starch synthase